VLPLSAVLTPASTHDTKVVTDLLDNAVIKRPTTVSSTFLSTTEQRKTPQHRCLDRAYNSKSIESEIINRGYVPHMPYKRGQVKDEKTYQKRYSYSVKNKRWVVERTNS